MNQKQKRKINIVDVFLIVALLFALTATGFGLINGLGGGGEKVSIRFIMEVSPIETEFCSKVSAQDPLYSYESGSYIGRVYATSHSQAYYEGTDSHIEGSSVLYISVEASAVKTDTGYIAGDTPIGIGRTVEMRLPDLYCIGKCVSIEIKE